MNKQALPSLSRRARAAQLATAFALAAALAACGGDSAVDPAPAPAPAGFAGGNVTLDFAAQAGSTPVTCSTASIANLGSANTSARLQDLRFYVSNVRFVRADGSEQPLALNTAGSNANWSTALGSDSLTLIDLEDATGACATGSGTAATNSRVDGTLPAGNYVAVRFNLGVPHALNHLDPMDAGTPLPLTSHALGWTWTSGRIFAKIEVTAPADSAAWTPAAFTAHLGAGGCVGDPSAGQAVDCSRPNRGTVTLGSSSEPFDPSRQQVVIDVAQLVAGNNITVNGGGASGCMSGPTDPECPAMFDALQINLASGQPINGGQAQRVFRAVAR
jgi:uncharacterized repeat protein (TIGR04052 family)